MEFETLANNLELYAKSAGIISSYREQVTNHADKVQERMVALLREYMAYDEATDRVERGHRMAEIRREYGFLLQQLLMFGMCIGVDAVQCLSDATDFQNMCMGPSE